MSDQDIHYIVTRPSRVGHLGDIVDLETGHIVPAEVIAAWHPQAVAAMVDTERIAPTTMSAADLEAKVAAQGVWVRDMETGILRGGNGGGVLEGGAAADFDAEETNDTGDELELEPAGESVGDDEAPLTAPSLSDYPIHEGGGQYKLSNGERVRGKRAAEAAQEELNEQLEEPADA